MDTNGSCTHIHVMTSIIIMNYCAIIIIFIITKLESQVQLLHDVIILIQSEPQ